MLGRWIVIAGVGLGLSAGPAFAKEHEESTEKHQPITMDQLPSPVRDSLQREAKGKKIEEIRQETEANGQVRYEAEIVSGNTGTELEFDQHGKVVERHSHSESQEKEHGGK